MSLKPYKIDLSGFEGDDRVEVNTKIQKKAFDLGWAWNMKNKVIKHENAAFLFLWGNGDIGMLDDDRDFYRDWFDKETADYKSISVEDFLLLEDGKE